jgi:hypothetical protein
MSFTQPLDALGRLVREFLESEGFVSGVEGWRISRDGNAEFNDVTLRGTWLLSAPDGSVIRGQNGKITLTSATGDVFTIAPYDPLVPANKTPTITATLASQPGDTAKLYAYDVGDGGVSWRLDASDHVSAIDGATVINNTARIQSSATSFGATRKSDGLMFGGNFASNDIGAQIGWTDEVDYHFVSCNQSNTVTTRPFVLSSGIWTTIPKSNGWADGASGDFKLQAKRLATDGLIAVVGTTRNGTTANGTVFGTLPVGFRPAAEVFLQLPVNSGEVHGISIKATGTMTIVRSAAAAAFTTMFISGVFPVTGWGPDRVP